MKHYFMNRIGIEILTGHTVITYTWLNVFWYISKFWNKYFGLLFSKILQGFIFSHLHIHYHMQRYNACKCNISILWLKNLVFQITYCFVILNGNWYLIEKNEEKQNKEKIPPLRIFCANNLNKMPFVIVLHNQTLSCFIENQIYRSIPYVILTAALWTDLGQNGVSFLFICFIFKYLFVQFLSSVVWILYQINEVLWYQGASLPSKIDLVGEGYTFCCNKNVCVNENSPMIT